MASHRLHGNRCGCSISFTYNNINRCVMSLIYMQDTIDYMHSVEPNLLEKLISLGEPEIKEIIREDTIKYYKFA